MAGLALLGTVLVASLLATSRQNVQAARAGQRLAACRMADALLEQWWREPERLRQTGDGDVPGHPGWRWRTKPVPSVPGRDLDVRVMALEVFHDSPPSEECAVHIELVMKGRADATSPDAP